MDATRDEAMTTVVPIIVIDANDTRALPGGTALPTTAPVDREAHNNDGDGHDENAAIHTMLLEAAADPEQPSLDRWQLLSGFRGKAVEEAYQAGQASVRAMGVAVEAVLYTFWVMLTIEEGNGTSSSEMLGSDFPVFAIMLGLTVAPLTIQMLQEWKPVKHRSLVQIYVTCCCATGSAACLILLVALVWLVIDQGHAVSRPDLVVWNLSNLLCPLLMILLLRPSPWVIFVRHVHGERSDLGRHRQLQRHLRF